MRTSTAVVLVIAVIIIAGGAWWLFGQGSTTNNQANITTNTNTDTTGTSASSTDQTQTGTGTTVSTGVTVSTAPTSATVHYTSNGLSPATVTIAKGGTVTFINDTTGQMWIASAPHPTHTAYDGTSRTTHCAAGYTGPAPFDQCAPGNTFSFTFNKTGSWQYHNHLGTGDMGTVVVQ